MPEKFPDIVLRHALPADLEAMLAMVNQLSADHIGYDAARFREPTVDKKRAAYAHWLQRAQRDDGILSLVACRPGQPHNLIGYAIAECFSEQPEYWSGPSVYLHDLFVEPAARNSGAGQCLLSAVRQWAGQKDITQIRALVASGNLPAQRFFGAHGFRTSALEMALDEVAHDA